MPGRRHADPAARPGHVVTTAPPLSAIGSASWALAELGVGASLLLLALAWRRGEAVRRAVRKLLGGVAMLLPERARAGLAAAFRGWRRCYRYDYRREWLRFIDTLAAGDDDRESLPERVVRAVAGVVGAGGGAVWSLEANGRLRLLACRNLPPPPESSGSAPGLLEALAARNGPVELAYAARLLGVELPAWLPRPPQAWLLLVLIHRGRPSGLMVLAEPRAPRELSWEERDLLRTLACEAASYLAEDHAAQTLAETRELAAFNRRFAFVMHDIKNIAAQLTLTLGNARRHRHNPEFVDDMVKTLEDSVGRMQLLLAQLRAGASAAAVQETDLAEVLAELAGGKGRRPRLAAALPRLRVRTDRARLVTVLQHLIDNGFEAAGKQGSVSLTLRREGEMAVIEVSDDGPGMSPEFVRQRLFRPFASTKPNGLGIGVYEAKTVVEELGGRLEADSRPGRGTTMRIHLPCGPQTT